MKTKHVLKSPVGDLTEMSLDFSGIRGRDIIAYQDEYEAVTGDSISMVVELDKKFQAFVASKLAQVPYDVILDLSMKDFAVITMTVQRFLLGRE